jgi:NAD(P)-dependent dehydrogenase (short-subunit alcohol dehydrogenase family)
MTVTTSHGRTGTPLVGGYGPAQAAKDALTRDLSAELAPQGIRMVGLRPQGMPETRTIKDGYEPRAKATGMTWEQFQEMLASRTHPRRLMTLEEMANTAVFMASDQETDAAQIRPRGQRRIVPGIIAAWPRAVPAPRGPSTLALTSNGSSVSPSWRA